MSDINIQADSDGPNGRPRWRLVDIVRKVRTPWQDGRASDDPNRLRGARLAVQKADRSKIIPHRHSLDGEWLIVHTLL